MAMMKNAEEMMEKFDGLYKKMSASGKVEDMILFGRVMREAVQELSRVRPERTDELIEELCAINWKNYLTRREAEDIVSKMEPEPKWSLGQLEAVLNKEGLPAEEEPYYNEYALWAEVSKIYSDSGRRLKEHLDRAGLGSEVELVKLIYGLAIDHLKDMDGVYDIRRYFGLS